MSTRISRRTWLTTSVPALGGLLLTGCSRETFVPPRVRGGLIGAADVLTMSTNRLLLSGQQLAREYSRSDIADPFPTWNQTNPRNAEYQHHASEGFRNWRLPISGLVRDRASCRSTRSEACPPGRRSRRTSANRGGRRSANGRVPRSSECSKRLVASLPAARYVVIDTFDGWYEGYDLFEVAHAQTILAYGLNGRDLPRGNGAPLRLRVERQCGYKNLKFLKSIRVVDSMAGIGRGTGGINSDFGFHWFAGV